MQFADGRPVVAWIDNGRLRVAVASARGGRLRTSEVATDVPPSWLSLAGGGRSPGLLLWAGRDGALAAELRGGRIGQPDPLPVTMHTTPAAAVDSRGGATVAFQDPPLGSWQVAVLDRPPGGGFSAPQRLAAAGSVLSLHVVRDAREGSALLWWSLPQEGRVPRLLVEAVSRPPRGEYGVTRPLSTPGADVIDAPSLAADADGNALAAWIEGDGGVKRRLIVAERRAGGDWGPARIVLASRQRIRTPDVALNDRGEGAVVVSVTCNLRAALMTVRRSSSSAWGRPEVVASWAGYIAYASVGIDSRGGLTALWLRRTRGGESQDDVPAVVATRSP